MILPAVSESTIEQIAPWISNKEPNCFLHHLAESCWHQLCLHSNQPELTEGMVGAVDCKKYMMNTRTTLKLHSIAEQYAKQLEHNEEN